MTHEAIVEINDRPATAEELARLSEDAKQRLTTEGSVEVQTDEDRGETAAPVSIPEGYMH